MFKFIYFPLLQFCVSQRCSMQVEMSSIVQYGLYCCILLSYYFQAKFKYNTENVLTHPPPHYFAPTSIAVYCSLNLTPTLVAVYLVLSSSVCSSVCVSLCLTDSGWSGGEGEGGRDWNQCSSELPHRPCCGCQKPQGARSCIPHYTYQA